MPQPLVSAFRAVAAEAGLPEDRAEAFVAETLVAAVEALDGATVGHAVLPTVVPKVRDVVPADAARTLLATIDAIAARLVAHTAAASNVVDDRAEQLSVHALDVEAETLAVAAVYVANEKRFAT